MCRILAYIGKNIELDTILFKPDNSLTKQSYAPQLMSVIQNLAGFGMSTWDDASRTPKQPFIYRSTALPFYDYNLKELARKLDSNCILAHIRGTPYEESAVISQHNIHPFMQENSCLTFAHNGMLPGFELIKYDFIKYIKPSIFNGIHGTTDSEWMYALFLSQLPDTIPDDIQPEMIREALFKTIDILKTITAKRNIFVSSPLNFFFSNGQFVIALRYTMNYGHVQPPFPQRHVTIHSLWYTFGETYGMYHGTYQMLPSDTKQSVIIASEPLTLDQTTWLEVPEYSIFYAVKTDCGIDISIEDIPF